MNRFSGLGISAVVVLTLGASLLNAGGPVIWLPDSDGNWEDATNWSSNPALPSSLDDVVIDVGGGAVRTITIDSGAQTAGTLNSQENIAINGGSLTISSGGTIAADLSLSSGTTLTLSGGGLTADSVATADEATILAATGGTIDFSPLTSYTGASSFPNTLQADGGGTLNLSGVTSFMPGTFWNTRINAFSGSTVDLSGVAAISSGAAYFRADGAGSVIDLSNLTSFSDTNASDSSRLQTSSGGTILMGNLTSLDAVDLYIGGTMSTAQLTSATNGSIFVDGQAADLTGLTSLNGSQLVLLNGATADITNVSDIDRATLASEAGTILAVPAATSYAGATDFNSFLQASAGGTLDLSAITAFAGGEFWNTDVQATAGGIIDLRNVPSITTGAVAFHSSGAGSVIDLSSLTQFHDTNLSDVSELRAFDGGEILMNNLTTLDAVNLFVGGPMSTAQITSFTNAGITVSGVAADFSGLVSLNGVTVTAQSSGTADFGNVTDIDRASFYAEANSTLNAPAATSYTGATDFNSFLRANGTNSHLDMANITAFSGGDFWNTDVIALNGGLVDFSSVPEIVSGAVAFDASGADSVIDLSGLTRFTDTNPSDISELRTQNGGTIRMANLTTLDAVNLYVGGTMETSQLTSFTNASITVDGVVADFGGLTSINGISVSADNGGTADISNATDIDRASFYAWNGSTVKPVATSYTGATNFSSVIQAQGANALVDGSSVTSFVGGDFFNTDVNAFNGGRVDLSNVTSISEGAVRFHALGVDGVIDLSSLTSFTDTNVSDISEIRVTSGASILMPNLTTLDSVDLYVGGTVDTAQITSFTNGTITADGVTADFSGLTNIDRVSLNAFTGGLLEFPNVSSYVGASEFSSVIQANGTGAIVDLSNWTSLAGGGFFNTDVQAFNGGHVDLSRVTAITEGAVVIRASGADSLVDLSELAQFSDTNPSDVSQIHASFGGTIRLSPLTTAVSNVIVTVDDTGTIEVGTLELQEGSVLMGGGTFDDTVVNNGGTIRAQAFAPLMLTGSVSQTAGRIVTDLSAILQFGASGTGNVTIEGGEVGGLGTIEAGRITMEGGRTNPGLSIGDTTIDGDLTYLEASVAFFEINGNADNDALVVTGAVDLGGELDGAYSGSRLPADSTETFTIITAGSVAGQFTNPAGDHLFSGVFLEDVQVNAQDVVVMYYQAVPGDFDGDRDVDGEDFLTWQNNFGTTEGAEWTDGDVDDDGDVDGTDFLAWQNNFGFVSPGGSGRANAIPEPAASLLALIAIAILAQRRTANEVRIG